ncbi:MAG: adenylate/guanylate cyclase domain-containing protein [Flavobacteriales bacterium]|nr:adenylate/guanylate cyclase domain-containing protein [Flavobacteriales bacterium]
MLMLVSFAFTVFLMKESGGLLSPLVIYLMIVPAFVVLIANTLSVIIWTAAGVLAVSVFHYLHVTGVLSTQIKDVEAYLPNATANYISAIIFIAGLFLYSEISRRKAREEMLKAKKRSDDLLLNILPEETATELKETGTSPARLYDSATVLFTDFKGFTAASERVSPQELLEELNEYFMRFDVIMERHGLEKIKTIGDAYMAAGGLPTSNSTHAVDVVNAALEIRDFMVSRKDGFEIRIGIHTGPVVAGIVGIKKFAYDIWGDTVNTASRMESSGEVGKVNVSETTYNLVKDQFTCEYRGEIEAKGKGKVKMFFVERSKIPQGGVERVA